MTTLGGAAFTSPLESPSFVIWNDTAGSIKTVTVEFAQASAAAALTNGDIWLEVEELGTSGFPLSVFQINRKTDILASNVAHATSSVTWNNMTTPTKQYLTMTFTPQNKGYFIAKIKLAAPSITVYIDPVMTVS